MEAAYTPAVAIAVLLQPVLRRLCVVSCDNRCSSARNEYSRFRLVRCAAMTALLQVIVVHSMFQML